MLNTFTIPALVKLIKTCNYDVNTNLDRLGTFLILSIKCNYTEEVRNLLSHGANPNLGLYAHLYSPLASAVEYGASLEIIMLGRQCRRVTPLHFAAMKGRMDVLRRLIDSGADVNEIGFEYGATERFAEMAGSTLHFAVGGGEVEVVRLLLEKGADRELRDAQGRTALERVREKGFEDIITLLDS